MNSFRSRTASECYAALETTANSSSSSPNFYSLVYKLDMTHHETNDFSGVLVWNARFNRSFDHHSLVLSSPYNIYKCHYRQDIIPSASSSSSSPSTRVDLEYAQTYCIFGYESSMYEPPVLQNLFASNTSYFAMLVRKWLYGSSNPLVYQLPALTPTAAVDQPWIPNVVHLIWFGQKYKGLKFIEYLCLKSILHVLKPDKVKIHGDVEPDCELWRRTIKRHPKIEWVHLARPTLSHGQNFSLSPIQHLADVARLEVMLREGGIYSDFDILWVRPIDHFRYARGIDLIASNDLTSYCPQFPNNIQIGAFLAPPRSQFVRKWLRGYREKYHLFPGDYVAVSMCEPYKLYEKEPHKVLIDNRLQMIYFNGWSAFIPRYIDIDQGELKSFNEHLDWLNNGSYGYHMPRHGALYTRDDYEKANKSSLPIKIATYILNMGGGGSAASGSGF